MVINDTTLLGNKYAHLITSVVSTAVGNVHVMQHKYSQVHFVPIQIC